MVTSPMKVASTPPRSFNSRPCLPEGSYKSAARISFGRASNALNDARPSFVFNHFQHTNLQVVSFDIDTHYPRGWGGMSRFLAGGIGFSLCFYDRSSRGRSAFEIGLPNKQTQPAERIRTETGTTEAGETAYSPIGRLAFPGESLLGATGASADPAWPGCGRHRLKPMPPQAQTGPSERIRPAAHLNRHPLHFGHLV